MPGRKGIHKGMSFEIAALAYKKHGTIAKAARSLDVSHATISYWIHNTGVVRRQLRTEVKDIKCTDPLLKKLKEVYKSNKKEPKP